VCSGCSGDYEGDFQDCGEPVPPPSEDARPARIWHKSEMDRGGSGTERVGGFEVQADPQSARLPAGSRYASGGDICEILVGATQIVEIRIVTAKCGQIQELPGIEAETPAGRKHSRPGSAKYYRTRGTRAECRAGGLQASFSQGIAAPVAEKFRRWLLWAMQNVGQKITRQNSGEPR